MKEMTELDNPVIDEVLNKGDYAVLAISDGNDPYILNLHYGYDRNTGNLYFITEKSGMKLDFLRSNSYVCGSIVINNSSESDDSETYKSVVFRGVIEVTHDPDEQNLARTLLASRYKILPENTAPSSPMIMRLEMEEIDSRVR